MINEILIQVEDQYLRSGAILPFHEYLEIGKRILMVGFVSGFCVIFGINYLLNVHGIMLLLSTLFFTIIFCLILILLIGLYPNYIKDEAVKDIEKNLLPSTSFMHMLSKGGISIERIIERASETESSEHLRNLYNKFLVNLIVYGYNPQESLKDISARSPSMLFSEFLHGIISTIQTNGAIDNVLQFESEKLLRREEQEAEKLFNSLGMLSEVYVTLLVITPLLLIILLTTFSISSGQANSYGTLNAVVFLGIPLVSFLLIIIIDWKVS
jgi:flagellar protein FlaJ